VDTRPLLALCRAAGKSVVVPVTFPETGRLRFARLEGKLKANVYGIREPADPRWVPPKAIGLVIAPGSAFTRRGQRLGAGGGFYDRFLAKTRRPTVGLAFSCQLPHRLPRAAHDVSVDVVATADRVFFR
jgi:5-formyltetrahydrofolate cyclo-ligase